ncbi:MAG: fructosamine kinase family protein [Chloroflexota bacterium]|nr:fructosamine kinase family protein [Chloroflexota bacterium]
MSNTLSRALTDSLGELFGATPRDIRRVGGGDISQAARVTLGSQIILVKWHSQPPQPREGWLEMFEAEARGLQLLASTGTLRVPRVLGHGGKQSDRPAFIVMSWIERGSGQRGDAGAALGRGLSAMHRVSGKRYGLDHGNYCGATPQDNAWCDSWIEFYGRRRLGFQMELAGQRGRMPRQRRQRLERLIANLDGWIDESQCQPSVLHGDLWGGNWMIDTAGEPVLIDPAVYYGEREAELGMCHLFGGFPSQFFQAYDEAWPPAPGRDERISLYKLYHVLNHLNLFGEGYGSQVDDILRRYVS